METNQGMTLYFWFFRMVLHNFLINQIDFRITDDLFEMAGQICFCNAWLIDIEKLILFVCMEFVIQHFIVVYLKGTSVFS